MPLSHVKLPKDMTQEHWDALCWNAVWRSPHPIALVAADGHWLAVNPSFCDLLEYSEPELQRLRWQDITIGKDIQADEENVRRLINGEIPAYSMYKTYVTKSGKLVFIHLSVQAILHNNELHCFMSSVRELQMYPTSQKKITEKTVAEVGPGLMRLALLRLRENIPWIIAAATAIGAGLASFYGRGDK